MSRGVLGWSLAGLVCLFWVGSLSAALPPDCRASDDYWTMMQYAETHPEVLESLTSIHGEWFHSIESDKYVVKDSPEFLIEYGDGGKVFFERGEGEKHPRGCVGPMPDLVVKEVIPPKGCKKPKYVRKEESDSIYASDESKESSLPVPTLGAAHLSVMDVETGESLPDVKIWLLQEEGFPEVYLGKTDACGDHEIKERTDAWRLSKRQWYAGCEASVIFRKTGYRDVVFSYDWYDSKVQCIVTVPLLRTESSDGKQGIAVALQNFTGEAMFEVDAFIGSWVEYKQQCKITEIHRPEPDFPLMNYLTLEDETGKRFECVDPESVTATIRR